MINRLNDLLLKIASYKLTAVSDKYVHYVHAGIAIVGLIFGHNVFQLPVWLCVVVSLVVYFGIEFWFDAKYEGQVFIDNLHDFEDYTNGIQLYVIIYLLVR